MKTAFLKLLSPVIKLWRTVTKYVRKHILYKDVTGDGHKDIIIHNDKVINSSDDNDQNINIKEE